MLKKSLREAMTLTKEQLDKLIGLIIKCPFETAQPVMVYLQQLLEEQKSKEIQQ